MMKAEVIQSVKSRYLRGFPRLSDIVVDAMIISTTDDSTVAVRIGAGI